MTAGEAGFLASRVLAVIFAIRAATLIPYAISMFQQLDYMKRSLGGSAREVRELQMFNDLVPWAYVAFIISALVATMVLWNKAEDISTMLTRPNASAPVTATHPPPNWYKIGLRLLGLYLLLDNLPDLFTQINHVVDERLEKVWSWGSSAMLGLYGPAVVVLVGAYLFWFLGGLPRAAHYVLNYNRPLPAEPDESEIDR